MSTKILPLPTPTLPPACGYKAVAIVPDDNNFFAAATAKLYVGGTGDVTCVMAGSTLTTTGETFDPANSDTTNGTLSNGNLTYTSASGTWPLARALDAISSSTGDKFYAEFTVTNPVSATSPQIAIGLCTSGWTTTHQLGGASVASNHSLGLTFDGTNIHVTYDNSTSDYSAAGTLVTGDVIGVAVDLTAQTVGWYKNGVLLHTTNLTGISLNALNWYFATTIEHVGTNPTVTAAFSPVQFPVAGYALLQHLSAPTVKFKAMPVGMYDIALAQVLKTGTTATDLVGLN